MENIKVSVPNMISCKDLDYLSDMFNWNYGAYKSTCNAINSVNDVEIKDMLSKASNVFQGNISKILNILNEGGGNNE